MLFLKQSDADPATVEALKRLLHGGLAMGAAGVVGRMGLEALSPSPQPTIPFISPGPSTLPITVPPQEDPKRKLQKTAGGPSLLDRGVGSVADFLARHAPNLTPYLGKTTNPANQAWMTPLRAGTGIGMGVGGYMLADKVLDGRRQHLAQQDVDAAEKEYEDALSGVSKTAKAVDVLADTVVKHASDLLHGVGGAWATGVIAAALGGGVLGYNMAAKSSPPRLLNKALRDRSKKMWAAGQQPLNFVASQQAPAPAPVSAPVPAMPQTLKLAFKLPDFKNSQTHHLSK